MARILIGWEYGEGLGHLSTILPVARRLHLEGHEVALALPHGVDGERLADEPFTRFAAPATGETRAGPGEQHSFADILEGLGLADEGRVLARAQAWRKVLRRWRPHAVICEFAPMLALASRGDLPVVTIGSGFVCPPGGGPFPPLRFWRSAVPVAARESEARLARAFEDARRALGLAPPAWPSELLAGDAQVVCTWPELDPYGERRPRSAVGDPQAVQAPLVGPQDRGGSAFFYLAHDAHTEGVIEAIVRSRVPAHGYVRGLDEGAREALERPGVRLHATPRRLGEVLPSCSLVIHHGGAGVAAAALACGTPQAVFSRHLEQLLTGVRLERRLGVGKAFIAGAERPDLDEVAGLLRRLASSDVVADRGLALASRIRARDGPSAVECVARTVSDLL